MAVAALSGGPVVALAAVLTAAYIVAGVRSRRRSCPRRGREGAGGAG